MKRKISTLITTILLLSIFALFQTLFLDSCKKETLKEIPEVTVSDITNITSNTAISGGEVTSDGGAEITARGVCWSSTNITPTTADSKTSDGTGLGIFTSSIAGLTPGTTYYLRAYATNSVGTAYYSQAPFKTLALAPVITTIDFSLLTSTSFNSGGNVSNDGGSPVIGRGVCWSTKENPTLEDDKTTDGSGIGSFTSSITSLTPGTTYFLRAYATNSAGTAYGSQISIKTSSTLPTIESTSLSYNSTFFSISVNISFDGGSPVTSRGICWSNIPDPTIENDKTSEGTGIGSFTSLISGLVPGTTYYVRSYAINSVGIVYGDLVMFTTEKIGINFTNCSIWSNYNSDDFFLIDNKNQLFKSTDNCISWIFMSTLKFTNAMQLKIIDNILYASDGRKIYKSNDQGKSWVTLPDIGETDQLNSFDVDIRTNDIYATTIYALFRFDGTNWTRIKTTTGDNTSQCVIVDFDSNIYYDVYLFTIHKSSDKGITWSTLNYNYEPASWSTTGSMYVTEDNILLMNRWWNGVYKLVDNNCISLNQGFPIGSHIGTYQIVARNENYYTVVKDVGGALGIYSSNNRGLQWDICNYNLTTYDLRNFANITINKAGTVVISIREKGCYKLNKEQNQWELLK
jgi:hypothetical protein